MGNFSNLLSEAFAHSSLATTPSLMTLRPETEPTMEISADFRTITVPKELKNLAVKRDMNSETVYFNCPRYFDGKDLSERKCIVCYNNAKKEYGESPAVDMTVNDDTLHFGWSIDEKVTKEAGAISFQVVFETVDKYRWGTQPATTNILDGLSVDEEGAESDTTFWQTMTVQVDALRDEVTELQNDIEEYNDTVTELRNSISDLDTPSLDVTDESVIVKSTYTGDVPKVSSITVDGNDGVEITTPKKVLIESTEGIDITSPDYVEIKGDNDVSIISKASAKFESEESDLCVSANCRLDLYGDNYGVNIVGTKTSDDGIIDGTGTIKLGDGHGVDITSPNKVVVNGTQGIDLGSKGNVIIDGATGINVETTGKLALKGQSAELASNSVTNINGTFGVNINTNSFLTLRGNSTQLISPTVNIGVQNEDISYTGDINIVADDGILIHGGNGEVSIRGASDSENNIFGRIDLDYGVETSGSRFYAQANEDIWLEGVGGSIGINSDKTIDIDSNGEINIEAGSNKTINLNSKIKYGTPVAINDTYSAIPIVNSDGVERYMLLGTTLDALTNLVNLLLRVSND